jgi:hypothetical protein
LGGGCTNPSRVLFPLPATSVVHPASGGLRALEAWWTMASRRWEGFRSLVRLFQCLLRDGEAKATS